MDAISKAKRIKPDIVLVDLSLSNKNGYEVSREIKDNPLLENTSVILLISSLEAFDEGKVADAVADDFMIKPFNSEETTKKVESLIGQREKKENEKIMDRRGPKPLRTIHLSVKNRENCYELTEESAQELKTAIRMAARKARERKNIPHQISNEAEYPKVPLYRRPYSIALLGLSIFLLVIVLFTFADEKDQKTVSWLSTIPVSLDGSAQPRSNLGSGTPPPDSRSLEETPKQIIPVRENIGSEEIKGKTSPLNGRTQRINKRKTKGHRGRSQFVLASNSKQKKLLEQHLIIAFLIHKP